MDNTTSQKIREALGKSTNVGIIVAPDPNVDIMAAGLSLFLLLKEANKKASIACPTEPIVELSSLVGIDKVQPGLGGEAGDLVVSFPYNEGEIDKVSYDISDGYLNIIVKAGENGISFEDDDIRYSRGSGIVDLLFIIGTPRLDEIQNVFDTEKLRETRIINIDNKQENQGYGDIVVVSPRFSSISEQIADLALALGMHIDQDVAQNLLSGITNATRNFQNPNTSPLAFEMASFLLKKGANRGKSEGGRDMGMNAQAQSDSYEPAPQPRQDRRDQRPQQHQQPRQNQQRFNQRRDRDRDQRRQQNQNAQQGQRPNQNQQQNQQQQQHNQQQQQQQRIQNQLRQEEEYSQRGQSQQDGDQTPPPDDWLAPKVYKSSTNFEE